ncbi:Pumilio domain-containing protein C14orf21 [Gryllus bimaculatus]|nr:Pumilio domain-containing protein C14orf21 [Gryllus bimaculatus]
MEGRRVKKKRRTFASYLKHERYQGKRNLFGRGTHIDEETYNYLLRVMGVNISSFETEEDREIFIDNVFEEMAGKENDILCNQVGSRAIEMFLPWASDEILLRFTCILSEDLRKMCLDGFGSHVLQQLVFVVSARLQKTQSSSPETNASQESQSSGPDISMRFKIWLQQVGQFVVNNLDEFVWDCYANHVIRTVLECFSGLPRGSTSKQKKEGHLEWLPDPEFTPSPVGDGFSLVQQCGCRILQMPEVFDYVNTNLVSGLLQTILLAVRKVDSQLCTKIIRHLLDYCILNESQAAARLMEVMISVAKRKTFRKIYIRCFKFKLQPLSLAPDANFCVQSLIKHCKTIDEFEEIFEELLPNFEELMHHNRHGVLVALGQSCQRLRCKQKEFLMQLQAAFHCVEPERQVLFPLLVVHWVDYETWSMTTRNENADLPVTLPGSLLIQTLLSFNEPIKIIKALLEMDSKHLLKLLCDRYGSHLGDAFLDSKVVGEKQKTKFFMKLQGSYVALVTSLNGSRVLDKIWLWASLKCKKFILKELAASEDVVRSVKTGCIFSEIHGLAVFKRNPDNWEENQKRKERAEKLFADIIDP